jgi:sodium/proline symporter
MLLALFWRRSNRRGAMAGLICGGVMIFLWKFGIARLGGVFAIYELLPAFIIALIADIVVSLATKEPSAVITKKFDEVSKKQA